MRRSTVAWPVSIALVVTLLSGCAPAAPPEFPAGAPADYQLGGGYPAPDGVAVVVRDSTDAPADGLYSVCYVNGFQTQPGVAWPDELLVAGSDGLPLVDPNWPDEHIIDISTDDKRADAAARQFDTIDSCASAGFDAVEFDNLDSYSRSGGVLALADAVAFAVLLVDHAHDSGLAAGQKNTGELGPRGREEIGFDFAVVEECDQFAECAAFTGVYGDSVINIEYTDALRRPFAELCADLSTPASTILRDRALAPAGADGYVYERC